MLIATSLGVAAGKALHLDPEAWFVLAGAAFAYAKLPDTVQRGGPNAPRDHHRRATHSLLLMTIWVAAPTLAALHWVPKLALAVVVGTALGYGSHLVADWLTGRGVPWFWPLIRRRYRAPALIRVSSALSEHVAVVLTTVACLGFVALNMS